MAGWDANDSTSSKNSVPDLSGNLSLNNKKLKLGFAREYFGEGISPEVKSAIEGVMEKLKKNGFEIEEISLPHSEYTIATYYILTTAEASSNLARYDGARYGYRSENSSSLLEMYKSCGRKHLDPK